MFGASRSCARALHNSHRGVATAWQEQSNLQRTHTQTHTQTPTQTYRRRHTESTRLTTRNEPRRAATTSATRRARFANELNISALPASFGCDASSSLVLARFGLGSLSPGSLLLLLLLVDAAGVHCAVALQTFERTICRRADSSNNNNNRKPPTHPYQQQQQHHTPSSVLSPCCLLPAPASSPAAAVVLPMPIPVIAGYVLPLSL